MPPLVELEDEGYHVQWGGDDNFYYHLTNYEQALCEMVARECMAASFFIENGATPDGRPWGQQHWFRFALWMEWSGGRGDAIDDEHGPPADAPRKPATELNWRLISDGDVPADAGD